MNTILNGVTCDVVNCHYNQNGHACDAKEIHVGGDCCNCSSQTQCATFKPKS